MKLCRLAITAMMFAAATVAKASDAEVESPQAGVWLKGDLHVHSRHSEDSSNHPIASILAFADQVGMDYLLISDHDNHVDGAIAQNTWADPEFRSDTILLLYGAEWTTHRGHANPISARPYDHQRLYDARDDRDVRISSVKQELGVHLSVNHPANDDAFSMTYDMIDSLEVWNSVLSSRNRGALLVWDDLLKSGRVMTGRGGSDAHHGQVPDADMANDRAREASANNIGTPTTWVWAETRTQEAVVEALTKGRVSISANPFAPRVEFSADFDRDGTADMVMGDNLAAPQDAVTFNVGVVGVVGDATNEADYTVTIIKNGAVFQTAKLDDGQNLSFTDTPDANGRTYYRVEIRGSVPAYPQVPNAVLVAGDLIGLSNPLYFNFDPNF
ncbi:MAG: CehA/McbA family metallohydrolase [Erythrobacter sp.]